jgi:hypothetical protein
MAEPTTATLDAPSAPAAGQDALDAAIANFEATLPELQPRGSQPTEQTPGPADTPPVAEPPAPPEQPADKPAPEPGGSDDIDEDLDTSPEQPAGKPTSRMGRLRQQLTAAEDQARTIREQLQQVQAREQHALSQFVNLVLPDAEYRALEIKARNGDWEAKQKLDVADQWRGMAAPIADLAHRAVRQEFDQALADLRTLDGMDGDTHQKLLTAATPGEKLRLMHQAAFKAADSQHRERIAALEAEVQALKTNRAANGAQPASGGTPQAGGSGLSGLIGKNGQLTDDAMNLTPAEIRARFRAA